MWATDGEHRTYLPKLLIIELAWLTGWNIRAEIALAHFLFYGSFAFWRGFSW